MTIVISLTLFSYYFIGEYKTYVILLFYCKIYGFLYNFDFILYYTQRFMTLFW